MRLAVRIVDLLRRTLAILRLLWVLLGLATIVSRLALRITRIILPVLSTGLTMLESAVLRWPETIRSCWRTEVLIVSLLRRVLRRWWSPIVLISWLFAVLALRRLIALLGRIPSLLRRITLTVAGLLVALLAVLIVGT